MNAVTLNHAIRDFKTVFTRTIADCNPTIIVNDEGEQAVLITADLFNSWMETEYLNSNPANAAELRESIAQVEAGNVQVRELIED